MDTLFDPPPKDRILARIDSLRPGSPRAWGKMDPAQMLSHCALGMEAATGDAVLHSPFMAKLIGPLFKGWMLGPKPSRRTRRRTRCSCWTSRRASSRRRRRVSSRSSAKFHDAGPVSAAKFRHAFVQKLTGDEWGLLQWKHLDHHLRQFGA